MKQSRAASPNVVARPSSSSAVPFRATLRGATFEPPPTVIKHDGEQARHPPSSAQFHPAPSYTETPADHNRYLTTGRMRMAEALRRQAAVYMCRMRREQRSVTTIKILATRRSN